MAPIGVRNSVANLASSAGGPRVACHTIQAVDALRPLGASDRRGGPCVALRPCDRRSSPCVALRPSDRRGGACVTLRSCDRRSRPCVALRPCNRRGGTCVTFWPWNRRNGARVAFRPCDRRGSSCRASVTLGAWDRGVGADGPWVASWTRLALSAVETVESLGSLTALRSLESLATRRSLNPLGTLKTCRPSIASGSCPTRKPPRTLWAYNGQALFTTGACRA